MSNPPQYSGAYPLPQPGGPFVPNQPPFNVPSGPTAMPLGRPPHVQASLPQQQHQQQQQGLTMMQGQPGVRMMHPQHAQQAQQLTQASLHPPARGDSSSTPEPSMEKKLTSKIQNLFSSPETPHMPNVGYTPTSKMAQLHEKNLQEFVSPPRPRFQFQVTKLRSWRTGYVRILALYDDSFVTLDPTGDNPTETNRWKYTSLQEWIALPKEKDNILLQVDKDKLKFSCHNVNRSLVLTALLRCQDESGQSPANETIVFRDVDRHTRHGTVVSVSLHVKAYGLVEVHPVTKERIQIYRYTDIKACSFTTQKNDAGIAIHFHQPGKSRLYYVHSSRQGGSGRSDLLTLMRENCEVLGIILQMEESIEPSHWLELRRNQNIGTIATTWNVTKSTRRHDSQFIGPGGWVGGIVTRNLSLTGQGYLVERDGGGVVSIRRLADLVAIVRPPETSEVTLQFSDGTHRTYASNSRDAFLVSILDAACTLGKNPVVHLSDVSNSGYSLVSLSSAEYSETAEATLSLAVPSATTGLFQPISIPQYCLKRVYALATQAYAFASGEFEPIVPGQPRDVVSECLFVVETCREFNASVLPNGDGLPTGPADKQISGSVGALWGLVGKLLSTHSTESVAVNLRESNRAEQSAATLFQTLYRLSNTLTGYRVSAELSTLQEALPLLWSIGDLFCKFWALRVLNVLLSGLPKRDLEVEYVNKSVILRVGGSAFVLGLVDTLLQPSRCYSPDRKPVVSDLALMVASDVLQSLLCSYHDTTSPQYFSAFILCLAERHRALLNTLRSQTPFVIENTALLLHLLASHAPTTATAIRDAALSSGILLDHFYAATFSPLEGQRFLSRYLCSLWLSGPPDCDEKRLLKRMVPHGFLAYLVVPKLSPAEEAQLDEIEFDLAEENIRDDRILAPVGDDGMITTASAGQQGAAGTNTARLRSRIAIASAEAQKGSQRSQTENFRIFFHVLGQDHSLPDLIWSQQTRRELRIALESEIQYVRREMDARGLDFIAWNHQQFCVKYPSLDNEVKVGNVYMRLWLQAGDGFIRSWDDPVRLFELLFRRFLCEIDRNAKMTIMCLLCLERLYAIHASKIGPFPDVMILVHSMLSTKSIETQNRLLGLLATVLGVPKTEDDDPVDTAPENAEQLLNAESINQLCQFVAWGHTSGDHIGNILTRVLDQGSSGPALITNGSEARSAGNGMGQTVISKGSDAVGPAVWFVASTGKIPPPSELVKGPFRLSDLRRMMEDGNLTPFDLVTSSHVDEYDADMNEAEAHIDTGKWKRLQEVWQLRWQLCSEDNGSSIYKPCVVSLVALKALTRLVELHRSTDSRGVPYFPIPTAKRILCGLAPETAGSTKPLSILSQAMLCKDGPVVDQAAKLMAKLVEYNDEAMPKLYLSGVFFFAVAYTGSNFKAIAKLLYATHLKQHFRSGFTAAAGDAELPMKDRSFLGSLLPEGLLFILVNYGVERFAEVFVGNADTPEVIWTFEMRKHLIEMVRQHLGDFPLRLFQNTTAEYEYCPMPGVAYKRLEKEIFCHNYYLNNLCDEDRFPDWPIAEPIEVFRACLERFKRQYARDEEAEEQALEQARQVLSLKEGDGTKELRKAYRNLARRFHPDKNPAGRETFELIQTAYELLLPLVESGQTIKESRDEDNFQEKESAYEGLPGGRLHLLQVLVLIKAQLLICRRYERQMSRYKYPAYEILLDCLGMPKSCQDALRGDPSKAIMDTSLVRSERSDLVLAAVSLVFRTCLVSPQNAEELIAKGGVGKLASLLDFYLVVLSRYAIDCNSNCPCYDTLLEIIGFIIRTLSGVAFFESGRIAIASLEKLEGFLLNWQACLDGRYFTLRPGEGLETPIRRFALEGLSQMGHDEGLQNKLVSCGILWPLLALLLQFDPTLEDGRVADVSPPDDVGVSVAASNVQARLGVRALGVLGGYLPESSENEVVQNVLSTLLTEAVAQMLRLKRTGEILRVLNSTIETATIIWTVAMRRQLETFLGEVLQKRPPGMRDSVEDELAVVRNFRYDALKDECVIGGIYVRVFNKSGKDAVGRLPDPKAFFREVMSFVSAFLDEASIGLEYVASTPNATDIVTDTSDPSFLMAVTALRIVLSMNGFVDEILAENSSIIPSTLLRLLELPVNSAAFAMGMDILSSVSARRSFADAVARAGDLRRLLVVLERKDDEEQSSVQCMPVENHASERKIRGWAILESLTSSQSIAECLVSTSAWLELLGVFVGYECFTKAWTARLGASKALSRLLWDPAIGPAFDPKLTRFLPRTLVTILKEDPESMVKDFDGEADTPELIWNAPMRSELRRVLASQLNDIVTESHVSTSKEKFVLDADVYVKYSSLEKELFVGGVYVSRFLKEPTYNLRDPTAFLELLLKRWSKELEITLSGRVDLVSAESSALADADQDVIQMVTTAIVYLCKVRDSLCDNLAQWGSLNRCIAFLPDVLARELVGTPLLSIVRILHVAVSRLANIEVLAVSGNGDGRDGFVDLTLRGIGKDALHKDSAFMIELLKKAFEKGLGDVKKARPLLQEHGVGSFHGSTVVPPSPSPGDGPVRRKVTAGDDPLAMMGQFDQSAPVIQQSYVPSQQSSIGQHSQVSYQTHGSTGQFEALGPSQQYTVEGNQVRSAGRDYSQMSSNYQQYPTQSLGGPVPSSGASFYAGASAHRPNLSYAERSTLAQQASYSGPSTNGPTSHLQASSYIERSAMVQQSSQPQSRLDPPTEGHPGASSSDTHSPQFSVPSGHQPGALQNQYSHLRNYETGSHVQQQPPLGPVSYQFGQSLPPPSQHPGAPRQPEYPSPQLQSHNPMQQAVNQTHPLPSHSIPTPQLYQQPAEHQVPNYRQQVPLQQYQHSAPAQHQQYPHFAHQAPQQQPVPAQLYQQSVQKQQQFQQPSMQQPSMQQPRQAVYQTQHQHQHQQQQFQQPSMQQPRQAVYQTQHQHQHQQQQLQQPSMQQPRQAVYQTQQQPQFQSTPPQQVNTRFQPLTAATTSSPFAQPSHGPETHDGGPVQYQSIHHPSERLIVETVIETEPPKLQYRPTAIEGSGIDARTKHPDPAVAAEQQTMSIGGAVGAARGRVALLQQALACQLCAHLLNHVLENPKLADIKDPAAAKVHAIALLKLLTNDPGYGAKFRLILDEFPAWKKYKSQDHSLYITSHEQRSDYFLTDGGGATEQAKRMLTHG